MSDAEHWYRLTAADNGNEVLIRKGAIAAIIRGAKTTKIWLNSLPQPISVLEEPVDFDVGAGLLNFRKREA